LREEDHQAHRCSLRGKFTKRNSQSVISSAYLAEESSSASECRDHQEDRQVEAELRPEEAGRPAEGLPLAAADQTAARPWAAAAHP